MSRREQFIQEELKRLMHVPPGQGQQEHRKYLQRVAQNCAVLQQNLQAVENDRRKCVRLWNTSQSGEVAGRLLCTVPIPQRAQD